MPTPKKNRVPTDMNVYPCSQQERRLLTRRSPRMKNAKAEVSSSGSTLKPPCIIQRLLDRVASLEKDTGEKSLRFDQYLAEVD